MKAQLLATLRAVRYLERETGATTVRDVARHGGFPTTSTALYWLRNARIEGFVTWSPGQARTIRLTPKGRDALEAVVA